MNLRRRVFLVGENKWPCSEDYNISSVLEIYIQHKPGIEMQLSRRDLYRTLLSDGLDPHELHGRQQDF